MPKQTFHTDQAPAALGPYSQATSAGGLVFVSGQIPLDPETGELAEGMQAQADRAFANLKSVCAAAGATLDDVVRLTIYLVDLADFALVNETMAGLFGEPYPARVTIQVAALPKGARIEVEAIASPRGPAG